MGIAGKAVGPRGLALLAATAVAGFVLAVHGWSVRHAGLAPGSLAVTGGPHSVHATLSPSARAGGSSSPAASPAASPGGSASAPAAGRGPLLRSQSYAPYSYRVWPGAPSSAARAPETGLSVSVHRRGSGISVTAGVNGQSPAAPRFYRLGARVYVVEAGLVPLTREVVRPYRARHPSGTVRVGPRPSRSAPAWLPSLDSRCQHRSGRQRSPDRLDQRNHTRNSAGQHRHLILTRTRHRAS